MACLVSEGTHTRPACSGHALLHRLQALLLSCMHSILESQYTSGSVCCCAACKQARLGLGISLLRQLRL